MRATPAVTRRHVLVGGGALIVSFALAPSSRLLAQDAGAAGPVPSDPPLPGSLKVASNLDAWIRIDKTGAITVFTGKAELGQGIKTALRQVAAEELMVDFEHINLVTADTARTPNEGYTAGSHSMQDSGTAILNATAQVRELLIAAAASRLGVPVAQLSVRNGVVAAADGRSLGYAELASDEALKASAQARSKLRDPAAYTVIGRSIERVDIPAKVTGGSAYLQDLRLPGMVHARVVRPPAYGARLAALDSGPVAAMPGIVKVVRDGSYLAVIAEQEFQAVAAMASLAAAAEWGGGAKLPSQSEIYPYLQSLPAQDDVILDRRQPMPAAERTLEVEYRRPFQLHGSIGPSCAIAQYADDALTVWTHSQGVFPLRKALAQLVNLAPDKVHCMHVEGSGCYGHNGADDAAADAALIAMAFPGPPVRVQWMREQEHMFEPFGPAMIANVRASLASDGTVVDWQYEVRSNTHSTRPGGAGDLMPSWFLAKPLAPTTPKPIPQPEGGGDRNAIPLYSFPSARVVHNFVPSMPLRVSALRSLGAYMNIFAIESFVDELAAAAGLDPVAFRLAHLDDARARDVVRTAAERFGWSNPAVLPRRHGKGFAFARYKNLAAYAAIAAEVAVEHETGAVRVLRVVAAVDSGQAVNPDGIRNQIEGGIVQSTSWTLYEAVTFEADRITSVDWSGYPILRFPAVPGSIEVHVIDRPGEPYLGTGEAAQGPTAAALANAVADATKTRLRELPLTRERIKAAIGI
ncbi:MAG: xanthine dehydrogenase family protein molybdopterin-binding subunit [Methylobacteriaceae bacterium]|nr:xanthine dehydrogenase family protein molybdopterin-binding subunit [Methylobacteriaceae bacterium]